MDKAKEKALEAYPDYVGFDDPNTINHVRKAYEDGYNEGRKDSAITKEDIARIKDLLDIVRAVKGVSIPQDQFYEEVLKRYNNWKENKSKN